MSLLLSGYPCNASREATAKSGVEDMKAILISAVATVAAGVAAADPASECGFDYSSQVEIADCVAAIEARVDASMATMLSFAIDSAKELDDVTGRAVALPSLEAAQASWIAYRDAQCEYVGATFGGGSGTGIAIRSCRIELGRAREAELEALLP
jgi:uncharacterized protein YecT (DUF1311 family)